MRYDRRAPDALSRIELEMERPAREIPQNYRMGEAVEWAQLAIQT